MDTWIDAQAKADQGHKMIKGGLDLIQESIEMMERVNGQKKGAKQIGDNRESRHGDAALR